MPTGTATPRLPRTSRVRGLSSASASVSGGLPVNGRPNHSNTKAAAASMRASPPIDSTSEKTTSQRPPPPPPPAAPRDRVDIVAEREPVIGRRRDGDPDALDGHVAEYPSGGRVRS